jgi:hypothetical protein
MTPQEFNIALARLNMGRRELAELIECSPDTVSRYRSGKLPVPKLLGLYLDLAVKEHNRQSALDSATES